MYVVKKGFISSYDNENVKARVYYPEDGTVSEPLPILESCSIPFQPDEFVICIYTVANDGFIIGRIKEKGD